MKNKDLVLKKKGGGSIIDHPPLFSSNGETLYIIQRQTIRAYNTQTADFVQDFVPAESKLIKIVTCPRNTDTIIGCTENGSLVFWNNKTGIIKFTEKLKLSIPNVKIKTFNILTYTLLNNTKICNILVSYISDNNREIHLESFNYPDGNFVMHNIVKTLAEGEYYLDIVGNNGNNLIVIGQNMYIYIINPETLIPIRYDKIGRIITCLTGHPEDECVATGDKSGRVLLLQDLSLPYKEKQFLPYTIYHWHTLPVEEIKFSISGGHMYTGGGECVLVKWTINDVFNKSFLPRLPAPIKYLTIAPENLYVAISTLDNGITIVDMQKKLIAVIQNFTWGVTLTNVNLFPAGLTVDPRTNSIVLNSRTGHIQFYNANKNALMYNMNITAQNFLTQERSAVIVNTEVTKISINYNGTWMATVEERDDKMSSIEIRLKFWEFDMEKQIFVLNTSVELPHEFGINVLQFQPGNPFGEENSFVVTTGKDETFKLWCLVKPTSIYKKTKHWQCYSVGYYRNLPVNDAAFSEDGSLLCIGFDCTLTLWNPETTEFKKALSYFNKREPIKQIKFGKHDARHLVVVAFPSSLVVWDILTFRVSWSVPLKLSTLSADPLSSYMAAFTTDNTLYVFKPTKSKYEYTRKKLVDNSSILCSCFVPHPQEKQDSNCAWQKYSQLYFLDNNQELLTLEPELESDSLLGNIGVNDNLSVTAFSRLLATQTVKDTDNVTPYIHDLLGSVGDGVVERFLSVPAHTQVHMSLLCTEFLLKLNSQPTIENIDVKEESDNKQTLESDSDDECQRSDENATDKVSSRVKQEREESVSSKLHTYDWTFLTELIPISESIGS